MKKQFLFLLFAIISTIGYTQPYSSALMFGGSQTDVTMSVTGYGDNYAVGFFSGNAQFGSFGRNSAGGNDIFIVKYYVENPERNAGNPTGGAEFEEPEVQWVKTFGGSGNDQAISATTFGSGVIVTGFFNGSINFEGTTLTSKGSDDIFVVYINYEGSIEWAKSYGGIGSDRPFQVKAIFHPSEFEALFLTGYFSSTANFDTQSLSSGGATDAFVMSFDGYTSELYWARKMGGTGTDIGYALGNDDNGDVYVTGSFMNTGNFIGTNLTSAGNTDAFYVKLDYFTGDLFFAKRFGGSGIDVGTALSYDYDNEKMLLLMNFTGTASIGGSNKTSMGGTDILLGSMSLEGNLVWDYHIQGTGNDKGVGIEFINGKIFVAGNFNKMLKLDTDMEFNTRGAYDYFLATINSDGSFHNGSQYGGSSSESVYGICYNYYGLLTGGVFNGIDHFYDDLGTSPKNDSGKGDAFIGEIGIGF
jgi:hypothetical protein